MYTVSETLKIENFFSIKKFDWETKSFNLLTGDIGSGKSLCIKLLKFFEDIIPGLLILPYDQFLSNLNYDEFCSWQKEKFCRIFYFEQGSPEHRESFKVEYMLLYGENKINITVKVSGNDAISFESPFMEELLGGWAEEIKRLEEKGRVTPDGFNEIKLSLHGGLQKNFGDHFPMSAIFIPASRAALALTSVSSDNYLREYRELTDVLPRFQSNTFLETVNSILKAKIEYANGDLYLKSNDGRKVPIAKAASGQQEIVYVLLLLDKLGSFRYSYGIKQSIFIEEPSAHLFPSEQKQTIELIARLFIALKEKKNAVRIFITTHSPYILNVMNNTLKKGSLLKKYPEESGKINATIDIPYLYIDDVSAYLIGEDGIGKTMLDENDGYLYNDMINEISYNIDEDVRKLSELNNDLLSDEEMER
jgi:AAA15 family ATPase/GTPase